MLIFRYFFIFLVLIPVCISAQPFETANIRSLLSAIHTSGQIDFCGESVPLDQQEVKERFEKEMMLALWDRPQVILWIKRSSRWMPIIEKELKDNQLPLDLKYIPVIESAFLSYIGSKKGALGYWQFLEETGRKYGLTVTKDIDERRNLHASTKAAVKYLKDLHQKFDSWTLSAAAFNMGEDGLLAEIKEQKTQNYFRLYLPIETQRYILRLVATKLILSDPQKFGFIIDSNDLYPLLTFDTVNVTSTQDIPVWLIAQAAKSDFKAIKELNPEIRGHYLVKGTWKINIPQGNKKGFKKRFDKLLKKWLAHKKEQIYVVQPGDNLSDIADKFKVPLSLLIIWNRLDISKPIHPGDRLIVFKNE